MPPAIPERIACASVKDLRYALDPLRPLTEQPETEENWEKIARAIQTIGALTRGGATDLDAEYIKEIRSFSGMILNSMNSERTRLANVAVDLLAIIAPPLGNKFEPLIPLFVPTLIKLLGRTNKVFVSRATAGLRSIISNCPHPRILIELRIMVTDKSASLRVVVAGALLQCLSEWDWSVSSFAAKIGEIESFIRSAGTDSNVEVRKIARQTFDLYKQMFPDRVDEFLEPLTPLIKRYLDIKPKAAGGPASRKPAPVPAPRFPERRPAPAPSASATPEDLDSLPAEPLPKKIRVGASRTGPSRAAVPDLGVAPPQVASGHARVVSGPARIAVHAPRDTAPDTAKYGPMRAAVPSTGAGSAPVTRSVSSSGPSRMRVDPPPPPLPVSAPTTVDPLASSHPQPSNGPSRRFRPNRVPMDPSQMPQRVAVPPPVPKPAAEPKKIDGPSRVNLGSSTKTTSGAAPMGPPTRVVSIAKPERELKAISSAPTPSASVGEAPQPAMDASVPALSPTTPEPTLVAPVSVVVLAPSPASIPIPASAPASRPASTTPTDSRPVSVASTMTSMAPSTSASISAPPASASAPAPAKPPLVSSRSAHISSKVSALIKRGNPNAPPPFVPKRTGAAGGVGAGTASQMARQREAIAAREKREAEDAAKKAKWDSMQKGAKGKETKETQSKEKANKPVDPPAPAKTSRLKREDPQPAKPSKSVPAAPRKVATLGKAKSHAALPKVDVKELQPEMVAPVTVPLPGSPTPLAAEEVPPAESTTTAATENVDAENMVLDVVDSATVPGPAVPEPAMEIEQQAAPEAEELAADDVAEMAATHVDDVLMSDSTAESENDTDQDEDMANEADQTVVAAECEEPVQTPPRATPVSLIDQTPASTPASAAPSGFAFHPQLAQLMTMPSQPVEEVDDFLVDLASPLPKERPVEKEGTGRYALGDMGNTNAYLSQFTQDMMMLSRL